MNFNQITLAGRLGKDPELKYAPSGTALCSFTIAVNQFAKSGEDGATDWFDITAFGKQAETISQYVHKGDVLLVTGRMESRSWDDQATGQKRKAWDVKLSSFAFGNKKNDGGDDAVGSPAPATATAKTASKPPVADDTEEEGDPFSED